MTTGFHRAAQGGVTIDLEADEAAVLRSMGQLILELVQPPPPQDELAAFVGIGENSERPDDPVLARLFPNGYSDDDPAVGDFRRYTEDDLRRHKRENAQAMLDAVPEQGGTVALDTGEAHAWLKALNDARLTLGTRLGLEEDTYNAYLKGQLSASGLTGQDDELAETSMAALHVYDWLGELQHSLVEALSD
ncbi:DUF2017 domain-containing protein [Salinactinospora qingdaonensis]|uniref:DUF2017 domain-containing protein n=1 Tax=Salinactinospora qingdaonensis TaxID=702744 RepID=A0ABP7GM20_9ACTN